MAKVNLKKLKIGLCCKTQKEFYVMLTLIVYIQNNYNKRFKKSKRISLRRLVEYAIKDLEKRKSAFYPFPEDKK